METFFQIVPFPFLCIIIYALLKMYWQYQNFMTDFKEFKQEMNVKFEKSQTIAKELNKMMNIIQKIMKAIKNQNKRIESQGDEIQLIKKDLEQIKKKIKR